MMMSNWNGTILGPPHVSLLHFYVLQLPCAAADLKDRASMRTGYTASTSTAVPITPITLPRFSLSRGSIFHVSTNGTERYALTVEESARKYLTLLVRSTLSSCRVSPSGSVITLWKPSCSKFEGNGSLCFNLNCPVDFAYTKTFYADTWHYLSTRSFLSHRSARISRSLRHS